MLRKTFSRINLVKTHDTNIAKNVKNHIKDGILTSGLSIPTYSDPVRGSIYQEVNRAMEKILDDDTDWVVLHNVLTGEKLTATDALNYGKRFGAFFEQHGFKRGHVVHLILGNENLTFPICFGAWILGGCVSTGDVNLEPRSLAAQLNTLSTRFLICNSETKQLAMEALKLADRPQDVQTFCLGPNDVFEDLLDHMKNIDPIQCPDPVDVDTESDVPLVFWSSGTTGHPKAICHTHFSALRMGGVTFNFMEPKMSLVISTCFFHGGGFIAALFSFMRHQCCHHMFGPDFKLEHLLNAIISAKPKSITIGTHHYVQLAESELLANTNPEDLASLEYIAPAGAAVPSSCEESYRQKCPNLKGVLNIYGQTEGGLLTLGLSTATLGSILPGISVKVENVATGERCGPNEEGEFCYKTPVVMKGYHNRPKDNAAFFDHEGYAHSGDLVFYTPDGALHYVDRLKEIMKYKNNHVAPTELEGILQRHPAVQECLIFGKPDPEVQELISAVVVVKPGHQVTGDELRNFVNKDVTDYKKIRGDVLFRDDIPRNSVGKLIRREMREWARHQAKCKGINAQSSLTETQAQNYFTYSQDADR
ncbi:luciferin 4-monooxygenase-like isoform X1 [Tigriopus californicus]|uniref:luciferin 4-monooxygenase-like isoform X1 n=1 Tax=Tigriopus californicus TaxID=6832 RepID=UPI0027DA95B4|nr:luciferin 4-monooxygenase-like isoform X1 [Tigriopus californicus]